MTEKKLSRREAIKLLGAAAGASVLANIPNKWSKPELTSGVLPAHAQTSCTYAAGAQTFATPGSYEFIVPCEVTTLNVDAFGAQGGGGAAAGRGGQTTHAIPVTPGETLTILVGGAGGDAGSGTDGGLGGVNGGGAGGSGGLPGSGGGGWSGVMRGLDMLVVAGGGGGAPTSIFTGGGGGGTIGSDGVGPSAGSGGKGGTQAAGGVGGVGDINGTAGSAGQGGAGADGPRVWNGGGGGGGYFGGGGGAGIDTGTGPNGGAGGGGSSYPTTASTLAQGTHSGDGQVDLWW